MTKMTMLTDLTELNERFNKNLNKISDQAIREQYQTDATKAFNDLKGLIRDSFYNGPAVDKLIKKLIAADAAVLKTLKTQNPPALSPDDDLGAKLAFFEMGCRHENNAFPGEAPRIAVGEAVSDSEIAQNKQDSDAREALDNLLSTIADIPLSSALHQAPAGGKSAIQELGYALENAMEGKNAASDILTISKQATSVINTVVKYEKDPNDVTKSLVAKEVAKLEVIRGSYRNPAILPIVKNAMKGLFDKICQAFSDIGDAIKKKLADPGVRDVRKEVLNEMAASRDKFKKPEKPADAQPAPKGEEPDFSNRRPSKGSSG